KDIATVSLTDSERNRGADRTLEVIVFDPGRHHLTINVDLHARRPAGAIVSHEEMLPRLFLDHVLLRRKLERVTRPDMNQVNTEPLVLLIQIPAAKSAVRIHARNNCGIGVRTVDAHPAAEAERLIPLEIALITEVERCVCLQHQRCSHYSRGPL